MHAPLCCLVLRAQLHDLMDSVGDEAPPPPGTDVTAEAWLAAKGASRYFSDKWTSRDWQKLAPGLRSGCSRMRPNGVTSTPGMWMSLL